MRCTKVVLTLLLLTFQFQFLTAQQRVVDSLENLLSKESNSIKKVNLLNDLAFHLNGIDIDASKTRAMESLKLSLALDYPHGVMVSYINVGKFHAVKNAYDSALFYFEKVLNMAENQKDLPAKAMALIQIGNTHRYQSNYEKSLKYIQEGLDIAQQVQDASQEALALNIMGLIYQQQGYYELSLEVSEKALLIRQKLGVKLEIAASLGNVGLVYDYMGDFPKALDYYFRALKINEENGFLSGSATTWNNIGIVYSMQGESVKALNAFEQAYEYHEKSGNLRLMAGTQDNIGLNYHERGEYVKALEIYLQTIEIREKINDRQGVATSLMNIGDIYILQNQVSKAKSYFDKALIIREDIGNLYGIADTRHTLGSLYYSLMQYDTALFHYQKALDIRSEIGNIDGVASSHTTIGGIHLINEAYELAKQSYHKALDMALEIGKKSTEIYALKGLANAYFGTKEYNKALYYANSALEKLSNSEDRNVKKRVFESLSKIHNGLGQFDKAYEYHVAYASLSDSLLNSETTKQLTEMQVRFDTERNEKLIAKQGYEIDLLEASNLYRQRLIWIGGSSILLLFGFIVIYRSRNFALKAKDMQQRYSSMLLSSHEDERKRISRDLHDSVGQSLMLIKNKITLEQDEETASMVSQALEEVRTISKALHPVLLEKLGLTASIEKLISDFDDHTDILFLQEIDQIDGIFSKDQELQIFRIIQESVNNMIKHAKTPSATVVLSNELNKITVLIEDKGVGFDMTAEEYSVKSLGMKTLKERTQILRGKMVIDSVKGKGTSVLLEVPKPS